MCSFSHILFLQQAASRDDSGSPGGMCSRSPLLYGYLGGENPEMQRNLWTFSQSRSALQCYHYSYSGDSKWWRGEDEEKQQCDRRLPTAEFRDCSWGSGGGQVYSCHFYTAVSLKLESISESWRRLVKTQIWGLHPQKPWFSRCEVESEYLHF